MNFKSHYFVYISGFSFLLGIILADKIGLNWQLAYILFIFIILVLFWVERQVRIKVLLFFITFLLFGIGRMFMSVPTITSQHIAYYAGQKVAIKGIVKQEVEQRIDKQKVVVEVFSVNNRPAQGKLLLTLPLYPEFKYGDLLSVFGAVKKPEKFNNFSYDKYLSRYNIYALSYYPEVELISSDKGNFIYGSILKIKKKLVQRVNRLLPEPESSFLGGLLWGAKKSIDPDLLNSFNSTGTTHIIALSGYNITILGLIIFFIAPWLGIKRQRAFWLVVFIIILFVVFTGWPASVIRAAIMGILVLLAYNFGRISKIGILLVVSAGIMCLINPKILLYDVGFQLSFLATIGLIYLSPRLEKYFSFLPQKFAIQESVVATISAIIMTAPLVVYQFHRFSLVALLANILILFIIPFTMGLGFLSVLSSFIFYPTGQVLAWLTWFCLHYIVELVYFLGAFSFSSLQINIFPLFYLLLFYSLIFLYIFYYYVKKFFRIFFQN